MKIYNKTLLTICLLFVSIMFHGCATSNMTEEVRSEIPQNATTIQLQSEIPPDELYRNAYRMLRQQGFRFSETNEEMLDLSTEGTKVGNSQVDLRIDLFVESNNGNSVLTATAEYELTPGNWRPVAFKDSGTKYKLGFEELVLLMRKLENAEIAYIVDENRANRAFGIN